MTHCASNKALPRPVSALNTGDGKTLAGCAVAGTIIPHLDIPDSPEEHKSTNEKTAIRRRGRPKGVKSKTNNRLPAAKRMPVQFYKQEEVIALLRISAESLKEYAKQYELYRPLRQPMTENVRFPSILYHRDQLASMIRVMSANEGEKAAVLRREQEAWTIIREALGQVVLDALSAK